MSVHLHVQMAHAHAWSHKGQKKDLDLLEVEPLVVFRYQVDAQN